MEPQQGKELPNDLPGIIVMIVSGVTTVVIGVGLLKKYFNARRAPSPRPIDISAQPQPNGAAAVSPGF